MAEYENDWIRGIVMVEVQRQLGPLTETVHELDKRLRSLYSNGSGGPPGAMEIWRAEDKKTFDEILKSVATLEEARTLVNKFVEEATKRQDRWDSFWESCRKHGWKVVGAVLTGLGTLGGIAYHEAAPVVRILIQEYMHEHPNVGERMKNLSTSTDPVVISTQKTPQDVSLPSSFDASR